MFFVCFFFLLFHETGEETPFLITNELMLIFRKITAAHQFFRKCKTFLKNVIRIEKDHTYDNFVFQMLVHTSIMIFLFIFFFGFSFI